MSSELSRRSMLRMSALAPIAVFGISAFRPVPGSALPFAPPLSLPQNDPFPFARNAVLTAKRALYQWSDTLPNAQGVPMATIVPPDALPTIEWLLSGIDAVLTLGINLAASVLPQINASTTGSLADSRGQLEAIGARTDEARERYNALQRPSDDYVPASPESKTHAEILNQEVLGLFSAAQAVIANARSNIHQALSTDQGFGDVGTPDGLAKYNAIWSSMPAPPVSENLHDDDFFAWVRVAGANPMLITRARSGLPATMPLTEAEFREGIQDPGDSLALAIREGRVYLTDYAELGAIAPHNATYKILTGNGYNSAPIAVFALPRGSTTLVPVAIQCGQDPTEAPMFVRPAPDDQQRYWGWQMAKTVVQTADFNYHEMFCHLARTHLISEAFAVATHRHIAPNHPLFALLAPHFEGDIFVNELARNLILAEYSFGDIILAAPMPDIVGQVGVDRLSWDFYGRMPRADLAARGVDDPGLLPEYPYRDDALLVWDAIEQWATDYVDAYYGTDADVSGDVELRAWADEVIHTGKVRGFRVLTSKAGLAEAIAMLIFTATAQHAAVNYPQSDLMTQPPFSAGLTRLPAPTTPSGLAEADWLKMLPTVFGSLAQFYFLNVLGMVYYRPLGDYRSNEFPFLPTLTDPRISGPGGPLERFRKALAAAEEEIKRRNEERTHAYEYLLPSNIPASTNI